MAPSARVPGNQPGFSQEQLKLIACISMLLDHIGAALYPDVTLRVIGRISFPIFCFLLAEGAHYTHSPRRYALRLAIGMVLSELPFDLAFYGRWTWESQSVMVTLLLGFLALSAMRFTPNILLKLAMVIPFAAAAEYCKTDYGGYGVLLIGIFGICRELPNRLVIEAPLLLAVFYLMDSFCIPLFGLRVPIEMFAILALLPIALYNGQKASGSRAVQLAFYSFYPVHLALIAILANQSPLFAVFHFSL